MLSVAAQAPTFQHSLVIKYSCCEFLTGDISEVMNNEVITAEIVVSKNHCKMAAVESNICLNGHGNNGNTS